MADTVPHAKPTHPSALTLIQGGIAKARQPVVPQRIGAQEV